MKLRLLAVGRRLPAWLNQGVEEYLRRIPGAGLEELPLAPRRKGADVSDLRRREGERMLARIDARAHVVALDVGGREYSTAGLAARLIHWMELGVPVCLLIGGPDGLAEQCLARAGERWSLTKLTLPHGLARLVAVEALYRAWTLSHGHPYHRD